MMDTKSFRIDVKVHVLSLGLVSDGVRFRVRIRVKLRAKVRVKVRVKVQVRIRVWVLPFCSPHSLRI